MKTNNKIWFIPFITMGLVLILINSCKKAADNNNSASVTDKDGNVYTSVTIGTQVWMAENLKTTKYLNGDPIGTTTPATLDISGESTPKYQWAYGGDESKAATYGRLYTWYAATDPRNICPTGWHVPTDAELTTLTAYLGGDSIAGAKLKGTGTGCWNSPNTGATNESGFAALPGGYRGYEGSSHYIGYTGYWWSSTEFDANNAWFLGLYYNGITDHNLSNSKMAGFSVRCLKDNTAYYK